MGNATGHSLAEGGHVPALSPNRKWLRLGNARCVSVRAICYMEHMVCQDDPAQSYIVMRLFDNSSADGKYERAAGYSRSWAVDSVCTAVMPIDYNRALLRAMLGYEPDAEVPAIEDESDRGADPSDENEQ
jgi:hypothetical protein